jgi:hypothetical protein
MTIYNMENGECKHADAAEWLLFLVVVAVLAAACGCEKDANEGENNAACSSLLRLVLTVLVAGVKDGV